MERLALPISDTAVCGEYLKANKTLYRALRNSFNQAQSSYRQLMESPDAMLDDELVEVNTNNWRAMGDVCRDCLEGNSKDIEIFCWFVAAQLFSSNPLGNLRDSLQVFVQVIDAHWLDLQPKPPVEKLKSDEDVGRKREWAEFKVKPLWQLAGESEGSGLLAMPLSNLPIIGAISYAQFFSAERSGSLEALKDEAKKIFTANKSELQDKVLVLDAICKVIVKLEQSVNLHCAQAQARVISFKFLLKSIENLLGAMKYLLGDCFSTWPLDVVEQQAQAQESEGESTLPDEQNSSAVNVAEGSANVLLSAGAELYHRDQAFKQLRSIADFFRRTEPHSPIHMLLERSIRWGYMSLPQLLEEMVGENDQVMQRISQLAGLESVEKTYIPDPTMSIAELKRHQNHAAGDQIIPPQTEKIASSTTKTASVDQASNDTNEKPKADEFEW